MSALPPGVRLAVVQRWSALRVLGDDGNDALDKVVGHRKARWPGWVPGTATLTYSRTSDGANTSGSEVIAFDLASGEEQVLYRTGSGDPPQIAPGVPHYVYASPANSGVAVVAATGGGLSLFRCERRFDAVQFETLMVAAPLFSAWSPSGRFLATHGGSDLVVFDFESGERYQPASGDALGFRAPAYSSDGSVLAYAVAQRGAVEIVFARPDGTDSRTGPSFDRTVAFDFRPGTRDLTVATSTNMNTGVFDALWQVGPDHPTPELLYRGPFTAFTWSPAGDRVALMYPTQSGDGASALYMLDPAGKTIAASPSFVASNDQRGWLAFFDQYAKSHNTWFPGGEALLVCGRAVTDRFAPAFGDAGGNAVYAWGGTRGAPLLDLGSGEFAVAVDISDVNTS